MYRRYLLIVFIVSGLVLNLSYTFSMNIYWEEPEIFVDKNAKFPIVKSRANLVAVLWHEFVPSKGGGGKVYLSIKTSTDGKKWITNRRFAGPYMYEQNQSIICSMVIDKRSNIFVAIAKNETTIQILKSNNSGKNFEDIANVEAKTTIVAPRLFIMGNDNLLLFVIHRTLDSLSIYYTVSKDGIHWNNFEPFVKKSDLLVNFLPYYAHLDGKDFVVFQSMTAKTFQRYQLYIKMSDDNGKTWSEAKRLDFKEIKNGKVQPYDVFSNQRPFIVPYKGKLLLTWERQFRSTAPQIYYAELESDGKLLSKPEMVTDGLKTCHYPKIVIYGGEPYVLWFDNRRGEDHIIIARKVGVLWEDKDLSMIPGESAFGMPAVVGKDLFIFWENSVGNVSRIYYLRPDRSVAPARLIALNFVPGKKYNRDTVKIKWILPHDPSGIAGVGYSWGLNIPPKVDKKLRILSNKNRITLQATKDGKWNFNLSVMDYAGNWSAVRTISYFRDTVPPAAVKIIPPELDKDGFVKSNTFSIAWESPKDDIVGYSYTLRYLGDENVKVSKEEIDKLSIPSRVVIKKERLFYRNIDNGTYVLIVAAIDSAGNVGKRASVLLRLNKYIPVTYIAYVRARKDNLGNINLTIVGRGFSVDGDVTEVILDRDGKRPFDYVFKRSDGAFIVENDRIIKGPRLTDIEEGLYRVGVIHPVRGLHFSVARLKLEPTGTVKFGYFKYRYTPSWMGFKRIRYFVTFNELIVWLIVVFLLVLVLLSFRKLISISREGKLLKAEILYLLEEGESPLRKEEEMKELKKRGTGLRAKFVMLIVILVFLIVLIVSIPLGYYMIKTQKRDLTDGLMQRAEVLLGSLVTGSETYLSLSNRLELALLPNQTKGIEDVIYATITDREERVWATNDPNIDAKVNGGKYIQAESVLKDEVSPIVPKLRESIDKKAQESISKYANQVDKLSAEARKLVLKTDVKSRQRLAELQDAIDALNIRITNELKKLSAPVGSIPKFDPEHLKSFYILYRPVVYRQPRENFYYHGMVRIGVTTARILKEIRTSRNTLIIQTAVVSLIAIVLGVLGAIILAGIIITPIKKLAVGVAKIRDTEDKEQLKDHHIDIKSKDEIGTLAETVNQMTQALVKAAIASKDLTVGKEIQKMFIPLDLDPSGKKGSTGGTVDDNVEIYGYYEGAKGVSGDYFDYTQVGSDHYAIIKCDVAGKGVPAALIMVEVATIFSTFFKNKKIVNPGKSAVDLVYLINDMLEERGFKGRFAALTVCLVNGKTGVGYFCNAGDNIIHYYSAKEGKMKQKMLPEAPAAGVFSSDIVKMQSGFQQVIHKLDPGDILLLFTDGLEEAKRHFRDSDFNITTCNEPGLKEGEQHGGTHTFGSDGEELGIARIHAIVNAVMNRGEYRLVKYHNPIGDEDLVFDFTSCDGTIQEAVTALVAVERIFRLYPDPSAGVEDRITIDGKVNDFLREHFNQYDSYFSHVFERDEITGSVVFSHLREDEQYDDLTILAVKKR